MHFHPQQPILLQNGQTVLQPLNLIGQQLLVPAGLVMTSDTVLQIQNVAQCNLITPQGIVQNKGFLSSNSPNQQFIVSGNSQISPIGQMYGAVGLMVPPSSGPAFAQQQSTMINNNNLANEIDNSANTSQSVSTQTLQANIVTISPPDTTTHSPRSPDRPDSRRSITSDVNMVSTFESGAALEIIDGFY